MYTVGDERCEVLDDPAADRDQPMATADACCAECEDQVLAPR